MEIKTKAFGLIEINPADILTFENGIIGFEDMHKFVLLGNKDSSEFLVWLQSLEDENLAFVLIQPRVFKPDYLPKFNSTELKDLGVEEPTDLLIYSIVVVPEDVKKMTANLRAPIIISSKNQKAKQIVLNDDTYNIKELIFVNN